MSNYGRAVELRSSDSRYLPNGQVLQNDVCFSVVFILANVSHGLVARYATGVSWFEVGSGKLPLMPNGFSPMYEDC